MDDNIPPLSMGNLANGKECVYGEKTYGILPSIRRVLIFHGNFFHSQAIGAEKQPSSRVQCQQEMCHDIGSVLLMP
ncbi:hypothetical protein [Komagataeibacter melaceti]|uniref:hypothetical protein n=1 Tax=Komagataeibacter melaceti TaxID=2766577 RepID=UPI0011E5FFC0|nr:hypothetical protein [Komagataeibacter melaceti]